MKALYLNGLSKMMLGLYGAAIIFGPPIIAQWVADSILQSGADATVTKLIWGVGTFYVFCISPFVFSLLTARWRSVVIGIVEK